MLSYSHITTKNNCSSNMAPPITRRTTKMEAQLAALEKSVEEQNYSTNQKFDEILMMMQLFKEHILVTPEIRSPKFDDRNGPP